MLGHSAKCVLLASVLLLSSPWQGDLWLQALLVIIRFIYPGVPFWLALIRESSKSEHLPFIALQISLSKSPSLLSFLSLEGQTITLGIFNFKLKCDWRKFLSRPKHEGVGEEHTIQCFYLALLLPSSTIIYPLLETEIFQRAVTLANVFPKVFILQITWLGNKLSRGSTFTVVIYCRDYIYVRKFFYRAVQNVFFFFFLISLLLVKSKTCWSQSISGANSSVAFVCALL